MWFIGKLSRDKRGAGSIIGATFIILILLSGVTFYTLNVSINDDYRDVLQTMDQLDLRRKQENIEFIEVSTANKLNITVKNTGSYQVHLIWLGIINETANTQKYYNKTQLGNVYLNPAETVTNIPDETVTIEDEEQELIIQLVTELGKTFSYSYPSGENGEEESTYTYDFVDQEGGLPTIGDHSLFSAQQYGPDGISDNLTEQNTGGEGSVTIDSNTTYAGDMKTFTFAHTCSGDNRLLVVCIHTDNGEQVSSVEYPPNTPLTLVSSITHSGGKPRVEVWSLVAPDTGSNNVKVKLQNSDKATIGANSYNEVDQTTPIDGATSAQGTGATAGVTVTSESGDLVQDAMAAISDGASTVGSGQTQIYNVEMGGSGETHHYGAASTEAGATSVSMTWSLTEEAKEWVIIGFNINASEGESYQLDLEVQWINADHDETNEWLCIYGGRMDSEDISVYVWSGTEWIRVLEDLESGWNNADVSSYLTSSTFRIRFRGGTEDGDTNQDSWEIDATFLHVWS